VRRSPGHPLRSCRCSARAQLCRLLERPQTEKRRTTVKWPMCFCLRVRPKTGFSRRRLFVARLAFARRLCPGEQTRALDSPGGHGRPSRPVNGNLLQLARGAQCPWTRIHAAAGLDCITSPPLIPLRPALTRGGFPNCGTEQTRGRHWQRTQGQLLGPENGEPQRRADTQRKKPFPKPEASVEPLSPPGAQHAGLA